MMTMMMWHVIGFGDEESAGEEYEIGEYVLEDLELGSSEKAGSFLFIYMFS
jgi:hypothetical protein